MRSQFRAALICAAALVCACTTNDTTNTKAQGSLLGAVVGGVSGYLIGGDAPTADRAAAIRLEPAEPTTGESVAQ